MALVITNANWVVGWNEDSQQHEYLQDTDVVFKAGEITYVGSNYDGDIDQEIEGSGLCVMPGLIDLHAHTYFTGMEKGFVEDAVSGRAGELDLYANIKSLFPAPDFWPACMEFGLAALLKSGVTTVAESCAPYPDLFHVADRSGMRVYFAPMFTSTKNDAWWDRVGSEVHYPWAEDGGQASMHNTLALLDELTDNNTHPLIKSMVMPAQLETVMPELLRASLDAARERGTPMQIHAVYNIHEFQEITKRHGTTPIKFMRDAGVLEEDVIIAHCIMLDHHQECAEWGTRDDLEILAESGASVDGIKVVDRGEVLTLDYQGGSKKLQEALNSVEESAPQMDVKQRSSEEIVPLTFSRRE
jgi:5-methylthioadenosine/S-adenosylhomocysteine deaminase